VCHRSDRQAVEVDRAALVKVGVQTSSSANLVARDHQRHPIAGARRACVAGTLPPLEQRLRRTCPNQRIHDPYRHDQPNASSPQPEQPHCRDGDYPAHQVRHHFRRAPHPNEPPAVVVEQIGVAAFADRALPKPRRACRFHFPLLPAPSRIVVYDRDGLELRQLHHLHQCLLALRQRPQLLLQVRKQRPLNRSRVTTPIADSPHFPIGSLTAAYPIL